MPRRDDHARASKAPGLSPGAGRRSGPSTHTRAPSARPGGRSSCHTETRHAGVGSGAIVTCTRVPATRTPVTVPSKGVGGAVGAVSSHVGSAAPASAPADSAASPAPTAGRRHANHSAAASAVAAGRMTTTPAPPIAAPSA